MGIKAILLTLSVVACATAGACSAQTRPPPPPDFQYARAPDGLMVSGSISAASLRIVDNELRPSERLIIKSPGGERGAALAFAHLLAARDTTVVVNSDCFSACALYLAIGAPRTEVPEGATLLFHNDTAMWMQAVERRPELFDEAERTAVLKAHQDLTALLAARGIDPALLECISNAIGPQFDAARRAGASDGNAGPDVGVIIPTEVDWVWLSQEVLDHFGARQIRLSWSLALQARESYSALREKSVAWIDTPDQCR